MAPQSSVPPSLPPSVEEAYRRKCVQLKNRTHEVEEANEAARVRLTRIKRQVEKLRIERAFLLEQLAHRTSANVEDSDGSPSPPPTERHHLLNADINNSNEADANPRKPKEKPLRIKRGHRKADAAGDGEDGADAKDGANTPSGARQSPAPDRRDSIDDDTAAKEAFELWAKPRRTELENKEDRDENVDIDEELERDWKELPQEEKDKLIAELKDSRKEKSPKPSKKDDKEASKEAEQEREQEQEDEVEDEGSKTVKVEGRDEDVEMADNDADQTEKKDD